MQNASACLMETLEERRLFAALPYALTRHGVLIIAGSPRRGCSINIALTGRHHRYLTLTINGKSYNIPAASVHRIVVQERNRRDQCHIDPSVYEPCTIQTFNGGDVFYGGGVVISADPPPEMIPAPPVESPPPATNPAPIPTPSPSDAGTWGDPGGGTSSGGDFGTDDASPSGGDFTNPLQ